MIISKFTDINNQQCSTDTNLKTTTMSGENIVKTTELLNYLAKKHGVRPEGLMVGFIDSAKKELYVWEWDANRSMGEQFNVLEIICL